MADIYLVHPQDLSWELKIMSILQVSLQKILTSPKLHSGYFQFVEQTQTMYYLREFPQNYHRFAPKIGDIYPSSHNHGSGK